MTSSLDRHESSAALSMGHSFRRLFTGLLLLLPFGLASSCTGASGGGDDGDLELVNVSLLNNAVWQINRAIEFTFSREVDFLSVSSNTINIKASNGSPATGSFFYKETPVGLDRTTVVWQPNCPTASNLSDAGLVPGGVSYKITVVGKTSGTTNTVRSLDGGRRLGTTQTRVFTTPASTELSKVFIDPVSGPPSPVVREAGETTTEGVSYVEIAEDTQPRIFFEFDPTGQTYGISPAMAQVPLNLYADETKKTAVVVEFNQAVNPSSANISESRIRLEVADGSIPPNWTAIDSTVQLVSNCTSTGATVRLEPVGLLPPGTLLRVNVRDGFEDIVGDYTTAEVNDFGVAPTETLNYAGLMPADEGADEFNESFTFGGTATGSFQDTDALFATSPAAWGQGSLAAAFDFEGTGGVGGTFDWRVRSGELFIFDTSSADIVGGPNFAPASQITVVGGIVDLRNLWIEDGGTLQIQGPNPFILNATGYVRIDGTLDISGFNAKDVATLNTGAQPEIGGAGAAGGGRGGSASEVTNNSTPKGGTGFGPGDIPGLGGFGGESGFAPKPQGENARRPGGGGGGRFAATEPGNEADLTGLAAQQGKPGHPMSTSAVTGNGRALGGLPGVGPFIDGDDSNNFFGVRPIVNMGTLTGLIKGELSGLHAGYGGGGGGDALVGNQFPPPMWSQSRDEKGGGGGGAAGGLRIRALEEIVFGQNGRIRANGGRGGTGENTNFLDHVGGTGGSASGGHVILESATQIDFSDGGSVNNAVRNYIIAKGGPETEGSKNPAGETPPPGISYGGAAGPGVIQLHVPDALTGAGISGSPTNLIVPEDPMSPGNPVGLSMVSSPTAIQMIPTFGAQSSARSKWIPIGGADQNPMNPMPDILQFLFGGTDTMTGVVQATPGLNPATDPQTIMDLPAVISGPVPGGAGMTAITNAMTLSVDGQPLQDLIDQVGNANDIYLRTPALLRGFRLVLRETSQPTVTFRKFDVVDATWAGQGNPLLLVVDISNGNTLELFRDSEAGGNPIEFELIPRFFRVMNLAQGALEDTMPPNSQVRILFEATGKDMNGNPDEGNILVPLTADITDLNTMVMPGELQFFRFQVEFDLATMGGVTSSTRPVSLDFLKIPFRF